MPRIQLSKETKIGIYVFKCFHTELVFEQSVKNNIHLCMKFDDASSNIVWVISEPHFVTVIAAPRKMA
jgi:hypothetical protein